MTRGTNCRIGSNAVKMSNGSVGKLNRPLDILAGTKLLLGFGMGVEGRRAMMATTRNWTEVCTPRCTVVFQCESVVYCESHHQAVTRLMTWDTRRRTGMRIASVRSSPRKLDNAVTIRRAMLQAKGRRELTKKLIFNILVHDQNSSSLTGNPSFQITGSSRSNGSWLIKPSSASSRWVGRRMGFLTMDWSGDSGWLAR